MRIPFSAIFLVRSDGMVSPREEVRIGEVRLPTGVAFPRSVRFEGFDLVASIDHDLEIEYDNRVAVVIGYYP